MFVGLNASEFSVFVLRFSFCRWVLVLVNAGMLRASLAARYGVFTLFTD